MRKININTWHRKDHFSFFRNSDLPFYNVNTNIDISGVLEFSKSRSLSFNNTMMFLSIKALNKIDNFKYRVRGSSVVLHDSLNPSFAHIKPNDGDLFSLITCEFTDDLQEFDRATKAAIASSRSFFDLSMMQGRDDFVFFSSMPWVSFTGLDHTMNLKKDDRIPRISWGKFFRSDSKLLLPYNIRVNHMFVDGVHIGKFFAGLEREIERITSGI